MAALLDAAALRAKYGEALAQETFQVRPDIQMVVIYGLDQQVCRIEYPGSITRQQADELIDELVPLSMRGKETGRNLWIFGGYSRSCVFYEYVVICEPQGGITGVTVIFKRPDCQ